MVWYVFMQLSEQELRVELEDLRDELCQSKQVCGVWCLVCGDWCVVTGVWCVVCGGWCVVCGDWCVVCV